MLRPEGTAHAALHFAEIDVRESERPCDLAQAAAGGNTLLAQIAAEPGRYGMIAGRHDALLVSHPAFQCQAEQKRRAGRPPLLKTLSGDAMGMRMNSRYLTPGDPVDLLEFFRRQFPSARLDVLRDLIGPRRAGDDARYDRLARKPAHREIHHRVAAAAREFLQLRQRCEV